MFGIGGKFRYNLTDPIRIEGAFTYYFPKTESFPLLGSTFNYHLLDFSVNGHYLFPVSD